MTSNHEIPVLTDNAANLHAGVEPAALLQEGLHHIGVEVIDDVVVQELINSATLESAMQALDFVNATVCGSVERKDHSESTSTLGSTIDGKPIVKQVLLPPRHRATLMSYALDKAKNTDSVNRQANTLAYGTVLAHNFADGNGRTARVVAAMVAEGFDPQSAESVANINIAATSREQLEKRPASFAPDYSMTRSWIAAEIDKNDQLEITMNSQKQIIEYLATESADGNRRYTDPDKINALLVGVQDAHNRRWLNHAMQQDDFGVLVINDALLSTESETIPEALAKLDDESARVLIEKDEDRKLVYSEYILDIAAGESKPYYTAFGQPAVEAGLDDKYLIGYH